MNLQYNGIGNTCHVIFLTSTLLYTIATFLYAKPEYNIFDEKWIQHGFCVVQENVPYWNSHDLCLYCDVLLVTVGLIVHRFLRTANNTDDTNTTNKNNEIMKEADEFMFLNLMGHLGHGVAHGFIAAQYRNPNGFNDGKTDLQSSAYDHFSQNGGFHYGNKEFVKGILISFGFWFGLLKGVLPKAPLRPLTVLVLLVATGGIFVRDVLGFAYVQAVIALALTYTQLRLPKNKKDNFVYAAFALPGIPLSIIPWIESLKCSDVASKFGGHLIYDLTIAVAIIVSYCAAWRHYYSLPSSSSSSTTTTAPNNKEKAKVF